MGYKVQTYHRNPMDFSECYDFVYYFVRLKDFIFHSSSQRAFHFLKGKKRNKKPFGKSMTTPLTHCLYAHANLTPPTRPYRTPPAIFHPPAITEFVLTTLIRFSKRNYLKKKVLIKGKSPSFQLKSEILVSCILTASIISKLNCNFYTSSTK